MGRPPKSLPEVWESHRQLIHNYYIVQDRTLKETIVLMKSDHWFDATQREYVRRLAQWQFSKNLKEQDWQLIHKRKFEGKQSQIQILDRPAKSQKVKRGLARYKWRSDDSLHPGTSNSFSARGIIIRTPSPEPRMPLFCSRIPWIQFEDNLGSTLLSSINKFVPNLSCIDSISSLPGSDLSGALAMRNATRFIGGLLGLDIDKSPNGFSTLMLQNLENILPRGNSADSHVSSKEPLFIIIKIYIYLVSNKSIGFGEVDAFLTWIVDNGIISSLHLFLRQQKTMNSPTVEIFLNRLLLSAINIQNEALVSSLLQHGVDPNFNNQEYDEDGFGDTRIYIKDTITPLQLAVLTGRIKLCQLLLKHGASPDSPSLNMPFRPLDLAISVRHGNFNIVELLLSKNADIEHSYEKEILGFDFEQDSTYGGYINATTSDWTLLMKAVESQNIPIIEILLSHGADPNEISPTPDTALQMAICSGDLDAVKVLVAGGANLKISDDDLQKQVEDFIICWLDLADDRFCSQRDGWEYAWKQGREYECEALFSPIEIATRYEVHSIVQYLLQEGATINQPLDHGKVWERIPVPVGSRGSDLYRKMKNNSRHAFQSALHCSVSNGDVNLTRTLLQHGATLFIDSRNGLGLTPLQLACGLDSLKPEKHLRLVQVLVEFGAEVNAPAVSTDGRTALQAAAEHANEELIWFLLETGADPTAASSIEGGIPLLEAAAERGNLRLLMLCVEHGGMLSQDTWWMAVYSTVSNGDLPATKHLLSLGLGLFNINVLPSRQYGITSYQAILQVASSGGDSKIVEELLCYGADANLVFEGKTALCTAVELGRHQIVDTLLLYGADPNLVDVKVTPLAIAAIQGDISMVNKLLLVCSNIDQLSHGSKRLGGERGVATPLFWAVNKIGGKEHEDGRWAIEKIRGKDHEDLPIELLRLKDVSWLLLTRGANPNAGIEHAKTVFTLACLHMDSSFIKKSIECGANLYIPDGSGTYPLQAAARSNRTDIVQLLLDAGADVNVRTTESDLGEFYWKGNGPRPCEWHGINETMMKFLINVGVNLDRPSLLSTMIMIPFYDLALRWINDGVELNYLNPSLQLTPLQAASKLGHAEFVQKLLSKGADVNGAPGIGGGTALQFAVAAGNFNIVKLLIAQGADVNAPKPPIDSKASREIFDDGRWLVGTALETAAKFGRLDIAHLLLENDGEIDTVEWRCEEAADIADKNGNYVLARTLRSYKPQGVQGGCLWTQ